MGDHQSFKIIFPKQVRKTYQRQIRLIFNQCKEIHAGERREKMKLKYTFSRETLFIETNQRKSEIFLDNSVKTSVHCVTAIKVMKSRKRGY